MKITTLTTYPLDDPRHGGQHRVANIVRWLRESGHAVNSVGVLGSTQYRQSAGFLPRPEAAAIERYSTNPLMDDWALGELFASEDNHFDRLAGLLPADCELVHVEQPWLFRFARRYAAERRTRPPLLVYGSENIEHALKRQIVQGFLGDAAAQECADTVMRCESDALTHADLVAAVSLGDQTWMQARTSAPVVLAPNGADDLQVSIDSIRDAGTHTGHHKIALYCASGHPPNIVGFYAMFGRGLGCLAPDERLVVAGGAGPSIGGDARFARTPGLEQRFKATGEVDAGVLAALIHVAHAIVLPITQGGGTNLKTAEALWAGHHIVATPVAMRGYEQFENAPGVTVAADPVAFRNALRDAMALPSLQLTTEERERRRVVLWSHTLAPLIRRIGEMTH